ncbi:hypothetical protein LOTGIDRAFT_152676 [Lottia gigantea]|uniref:Kazal-like domain-containing protein n=1 Tax=Lottia gigantea TaxID=225164 RepID=V4AKF6_LOTGI|nr:hypothetical protein LOTGIDRAFT_152676 [Lottia gigantea]ESO97587.1 hypothetical protein LOTGIDRAFT_152676 [Lottia gigantea]
MNRLILLGLAFTAVNCQFDGLFSSFYCSRALDKDCNNYSKHEECGQNGITYRNRCEYTQARCQGTQTDIAHYGPCTAGSHTNNTIPGFDGDQAALDFLCVQLSHETCPSTVDQVCASDNVTYQNLCEYEKQKCTHRDLHIQNSGVCA